jgi:lysophospholipase L1-like esterase
MHRKGIQRNAIVFFILLISGLVFYTWFFIAYLEESVFCSPLHVKSLQNDSLCSLKAYGLTPAGRRLPLSTDGSLDQWKYTYGFFSAIEIETDINCRTHVSGAEIQSGKFKGTLLFNQANNQTNIHGQKIIARSGNTQGEVLPLYKKIQLFFGRNHTPLILTLLYFIILVSVLFLHRLWPPLRKIFAIQTSGRKPAAVCLLFTKEKIRSNKIFFLVILTALGVVVLLFAVYAWLLFAWGISGLMSFVSFALFVIILSLMVLCRITRRLHVILRRIIFFLWLIVVLSVLFFETYFRIQAYYDTYNEREGLYYQSGFNTRGLKSKSEPWMMYSMPGKSYIDRKPEFSYEVAYNKAGFRDVERDTVKRSGEFRIIALGNSFTEGVGAAADSTWPVFLEKKLRAQCSGNISVFNTGLRGTDPCYEYFLYENRLSKWQPDLVVMCIGPSDVKFILNRGGFERFGADGRLQYKKAPHWEWLYALSHTFRYFVREKMGYNEMLLRTSESMNETGKAVGYIEETVHKMMAQTGKRGTKLLVVFFPTSDQVVAGKTLFEPAIERLNKAYPGQVFSMLDYYRLTGTPSPSDVTRYYWPQDGHHNALGYQNFAGGIIHFIYRSGIADSMCTSPSP